MTSNVLRKLALAGAAIATLSMAACNSNKPVTNETNTTTDTTTTTTPDNSMSNTMTTTDTTNTMTTTNNVAS